MLERLHRIFVAIPSYIASDEARYFSLANMAAIGGFLGHSILFLTFSFFHIWEMAMINIGSLLVFSSAFFINRKGFHNTVILASMGEIIIHAILGVILMGWLSGFYYYLSIVFVAVFLQKKQFDKLGILISVVNLLIYLALFVYCTWYGQAILAIPNEVNYFYHINNLVVSSTIIALGAYYYKTTANEVESKLDSAYKKITSSIRYSQRIQQSILPQETVLQAYSSDYFIFYRPKDIVSGDFYWFAEVDNKLVICAIDCTGHGVPGAFMTMLANVLLKNIVKEDKITSPALILENLHKQVVEVLRQREGFSQDGMDMAVCTLDPQGKKIVFAGAMNPVLYLSNQKIRELKANKRPIGGLQNRKMQAFEEVEVEWENDSRLYLFTDGITDQFSESDNKKFGKKQLIQFFEQNQHLNMKEQAEQLQKTLQKWMGASKQIDDMLVMGLRI
jgi:serine phosphatase RsbU (regulator of sigma subunit)